MVLTLGTLPISLRMLITYSLEYAPQETHVPNRHSRKVLESKPSLVFCWRLLTIPSLVAIPTTKYNELLF